MSGAALLAALATPGCVSMMAPSPQMADSQAYVRQHKGEGARRVLLGSEAELMEAIVKAMEKDYTISREPHAVFAKSTIVELSYAFYFTPSQAGDRTEIEVVMASNWLQASFVEKSQREFLPDLLPVPYYSTRLLEPDFDPNVQEGSLLALSNVAMHGHAPLARKLIAKGANVDLAIAALKDIAQRNTEFLDRPANKSSYDRANAGVELLSFLRTDAVQLAAAAKDEARFQEAVRAYHAASPKPQLPESARRFKVQAEDAARNKRFDDAARLFGEALQIAPWWPEGHFNRAVILGELGAPNSAILEMKRYLRLVPGAPNARAAQDKIYIWEGQQ